MGTFTARRFGYDRIWAFEIDRSVRLDRSRVQNHHIQVNAVATSQSDHTLPHESFGFLKVVISFSIVRHRTVGQ